MCPHTEMSVHCILEKTYNAIKVIKYTAKNFKVFQNTELHPGVSCDIAKTKFTVKVFSWYFLYI